MTMEKLLSQMGVGTNHITERLAEYPAQTHDQQPYYAYDPPSSPYGHLASSKHHGGAGHKSNAAMSALTLLAFLFFLHILQQCLKEHMTAMSTPQVMVVSAGREGEQTIAKTSNKLDKAGLVHDGTQTTRTQHDSNVKNNISDVNNAPNLSSEADDGHMTRIITAEHTPQTIQQNKMNIVNYTNRSSVFDGFVSAMDEK